MRMRFTKPEREAFLVGANVEVRNGRWWYPAVVTDVPAKRFGANSESIVCRITGTAGRSGTVQIGDIWHPSPTGVRVSECER